MAQQLIINSQEFKKLGKNQISSPVPLIPDLVALQYGSFQQFLTTGFHESFENLNPIICRYGQHTLKIQFSSSVLYSQ